MGVNDAREQLAVAIQENIKMERQIAALTKVLIATGVREELIERIINEA